MPDPVVNIANQVTSQVVNFGGPQYLTTISIDYLRSLTFSGSKITFEEELNPGANYSRYIASYQSEGNKIFGLLTIPNSGPPEGGFRAIVFNHGYIPPQQYVTTEKYVSYVDYLVRNGFVVFKIDMRGHGNSQGSPTGSYFSPGYTIDAINALKSLQTLNEVNAERVGMWGHSMSGNLTLRAMEVTDEIKAGVIWAGAVYSYEDFAKYRLYDGSYVRRQNPNNSQNQQSSNRPGNSEITKLRETPEDIDFTDPFWSSLSLTQNLKYLSGPVQLHHAVNDDVVNIGYSRDLVEAFEENDLDLELFEYEGGGHNIDSPYFEQAMQRTVDFYMENL